MPNRHRSLYHQRPGPGPSPARPALFYCLLVALLLGVGAHPSAEEPESDGQPWVEAVGSPQYFALYVTDMERSVAWYRQVLGLDALFGTAADDGAWEIQNLGNDRLLVELIRDDRAQSVDRALGFRKVGFAVDDVETLADHIEQATGERPRIVDFEPMAQRILQLRDPDGNTLQLFSTLESKD